MPTPTRPTLLIRLTHTGQLPGGLQNTNPVQIPDLDVGYENQDRKVPVYVPPQGHIDVPASSRSMLSFEQGGIRKFTNANVIRSKMFYVPETYTSVTIPAASEYPAGTFVWNTSENVAYWSDGTSWVAGGAPAGIPYSDLGLVDVPGGPYPAIPPCQPVCFVGNVLTVADATSRTTTPVVGFYTGFTSNRIRVAGLVQNVPGVNFTPGADLFLAVGGGFTHTAPTIPGQVSQCLGRALTTNSFFSALEPAVKL